MGKLKKDMKKEIELYKDEIYLLNTSGKLVKIHISSLDDYNHAKCELHHFYSIRHMYKTPNGIKNGE